MDKLGIIYNPASGKGQASKDSIAKAFSQYETKLVFLDITAGQEELAKTVQAQAVSMVVAAGGDGTVNAVASIAVSCQLPMAVLPLGTLNHFAKDLGLPLELSDAARVINAKHIRKVDYCTVNGQVFVNNSSLGLYPLTVREREKRQANLGKWLALLVAGMRAGLRMRQLDITLQYGDTMRQLKTPLVFIGNNSYRLEQRGFTNRSKLDRGVLYLYVVKATRLSALLALGVFLFFGKRPHQHDLLETAVKSVVVQTASNQVNVSLDGEIRTLKAPLKYEIHSRGLQVCADSAN